MLVLISYDVSTKNAEGKKRLRRISKICCDWGQRVQFSLFECSLTPAQWISVRAQLIKNINTKEDSLRFYFLGASWKRRIEHIGAKPSYDPEGLLIL